MKNIHTIYDIINTLIMQYRKLTELVKLSNNPRIISKEDMSRLEDSIAKFWVLEGRPLILSNRTGSLVIIAGNQRYTACKKLGIKEVPTVLMEWLSEEDEGEIVIRDNISNGSWNWDTLANEWDSLPLLDFGLDIPDFSSPEEPEKERIKTQKFTLQFTSEEVMLTAIRILEDNAVDFLIK